MGDLKFIVVFISFIAVAGSACLLLAHKIASHQCNTYGKETSKQVKMRGGMCFIKDGNEWYYWEEYKYRLTNGGSSK